MPSNPGPPAPQLTVRRGLWLALLLGLVAFLRGAVLLFDHSLHSIDGAMQTWFALDNFGSAAQLGSEFQSYLGVTMMLALLPLYLALGSTLFASTFAATLAVILGAFTSAYAIAWLIRSIRPEARWIAAIALVFVFYYLGTAVAFGVGMRNPLQLDPGVSLRPLRGALPFLILPLFVLCVREALRRQSAWPSLALGVAAGVGLLWSNDSGIPLVLALTAAMVLALRGQWSLCIRSLLAFWAGLIGSAATILVLATHGEPAPWLHYNFVAVAGDQFWYFAPWDRASRVFGIADLPKILLGGDPLTTLSLVSLIVCVGVAGLRRLRGKGAPVRSSAFVLVGASTIGTALVPQIGGHIDGAYNNITFMVGLCAPVIVFERQWLRLLKPVMRRSTSLKPALLVGTIGAVILLTEAVRLGVAVRDTERTIYDPDLGFFVDPDLARDLDAMRQLATRWDQNQAPADRRLLSVYTSVLDITAGAHSPTAVGSLIHALGEDNRDRFAGLVANREVEAVTTIAPDYSGWAGWNLRANWDFFEQLFLNYRPIAKNDQHVLWVRSDEKAQPLEATDCALSPLEGNAIAVDLSADAVGLAAIEIERDLPLAVGRSAVLTITESSPYSRAVTTPDWTDFPRYAIANTPVLAIAAPVEPGAKTELRIELLDGSVIGAVRCSARIYPTFDVAGLPGFESAIEAYLAGAVR